MSIETLVSQFGLPAVALGAVIEGETVVMVGGAMARRGVLQGNWVMAAAAVGSFLGDQGWFLAGRRGRNHPRLRSLARSNAFVRAQGIFDRYPELFVFGFRFAYGFRSVSPLAIGMTDYPAGRFMMINALSAVIWAWLFVTLGGKLGQGFETVLGPLKAHEHLLLVLVGAGTITILMRAWMRRQGRTPWL